MSSTEERLLSPGTFLVPSEVVDDSEIVPNEKGIYGWWFDDQLPVPWDRCRFADGRHLLYVGICPNGTNPTSRRTLRVRLREHCRGPLRVSTLRRTLAALIGTRLELSISRRVDGKLQMSIDDEQRLTGWLSEHARVALAVDPEPWLVEAMLVRRNDPPLPLNVMGSSHEFRSHVVLSRSELGNR